MMLITKFNDEVISNIIGFLHKDELSNLSLMTKEVTQETQKEILVRWYSQSCYQTIFGWYNRGRSH